MDLFNQISFNHSTGAISYPQLEGFELDMEKVYRTTALFSAHCSTEMAVRQAIHQQLIAHQGAAGLRAMAR